MSRMFPPIGDADAYTANNPFMAYNHIQITVIGEDANGDHYAEVSVELRPESMNLHGAVHGGLLYGLADCVAGIAARCDGSDYVTPTSISCATPIMERFSLVRKSFAAGGVWRSSM